MSCQAQVVRQLAADRERVAGALRHRRRIARERLATGMQPGVDAAVDRDLRDVALLDEMDRELRALLAAQGGRPASAPEVPGWLWRALPSERYRAVLELRRRGLSWRAIERESGVGAGNAATMAHDVARVVDLWRWVLCAAAAGLGRREIARLLVLPRWAVQAVMRHAPPDELPPPVACSPRLRAKNGRTAAGGRSHVAERPPAGTPWRLLRTEPGMALRVKAEIERRGAQRHGGAWRRELRCVAMVVPSVRPGGSGPTTAAGLPLAGLLAVQATARADLDGLMHGLAHVRGWVGRPVAAAGRVRQSPAALSEEELQAWFRRLGWDGIPEARA